MLRSNEQVSLDEVHRALEQTADAYADSADLTGVDATAELFRGLAEQHQRLAEELEPHLEALGALPSHPDADRRALRTMARHLRAALHRDGRLALLHEREREEDQLAERVAAALATNVPEPCRATLRRIRVEVDEARRRLYQARVTVTQRGGAPRSP